MQMIDWLNQGYNGLLFLAAVAAAVGGIVTQTTRYKQWRKRQVARRDALDRLIANESALSDTNRIREDHSAQLAEINSVLQGVLESQRITVAHNRRQDQEIEESLAERRVLMIGVESVIDFNIQNGANGPSHAAKQAIVDWRTKKLYKSQKEMDKEREE